MIRKQIYIDKRHNALLKRLAKARQVSEVEIIRQALDREALSGARSGGADPAAWAVLQRAFEARRALGQTGEPYQWKRSDAYEDRDTRFDKFARPEEAGAWHAFSWTTLRHP